MNPFYNRSTAASILDFNEASVPGIYSIFGVPANSPAGYSSGYGMLIVITISPTGKGRLVQLFVSDSGQSRVRSYSSNTDTWGSWNSLK